MGRKKIVKEGRNVTVHYTGTLNDGTVFDSSRNYDPISFEVGGGQVIAGFNAAVVGMKVGESKSIHIPCEEAYGQRSDNAVMVVPHSAFPEDFKPEVGTQVQGSGPNGTFPAIVQGVADEGITLDMNHPLAGQDLNFDIEIVEVT